MWIDYILVRPYATTCNSFEEKRSSSRVLIVRTNGVRFLADARAIVYIHTIYSSISGARSFSCGHVRQQQLLQSIANSVFVVSVFT